VDYHLPAYTYDKTSVGLIDAHEFAQDPDALDVHWRATQAALPYLPDKALSRAEQRKRPHIMLLTPGMKLTPFRKLLSGLPAQW